MGSSKSKPTVEKDESHNKIQMSDSSSGLHILEVHSTSIGVSVLTVFFILAVAVALWYICHRMRRSRHLAEARRGLLTLGASSPCSC